MRTLEEIISEKRPDIAAAEADLTRKDRELVNTFIVKRGGRTFVAAAATVAAVAASALGYIAWPLGLGLLLFVVVFQELLFRIAQLTAVTEAAAAQQRVYLGTVVRQIDALLFALAGDGKVERGLLHVIEWAGRDLRAMSGRREREETIKNLAASLEEDEET